MIYVLRHGEIDNVEPKRFMGQTDVPLTDRGIKQAFWWRRQWSKIRFDGIWCSDLDRSRRTAEIMSEQFACPLKVTPNLREINLGKWDGMPVEDIRSQFLEEWAARGRDMAKYRPPGGESFADLQDRIVPVFEEIARDATGDVLITAHSGVNRVILCHVLDMPLVNLFRLGQDFSALNLIERSGANFVVKLVNGRPDVE